MALKLSTDRDEEKVVGIKLEISRDILPRDTSIGTKIYMLIPKEARSVRDVKSYIAKFVVKTPAPFHFCMGEYRVLDDEDAKIFSIINEPCRLIPVAIPRSALSSTPKLKSEKRVTFFDGDISTSPVQSSAVNALDVTDHSQAGRNIHSPEESRSVTLSPEKVTDQNDQIDDNLRERKKRRRRRHRSKKSRGSPNCENGNEHNGSEAIDQTINDSVDSKANMPRIDHTSNKKQLDVLNEETESEDETAGSRATDFVFVTPTFPTKIPRKRLETPEVQQPQMKKKKLSDSAFESSSSFLSSPSTPEDSKPSKTRQDTPTVPRVIKNPKLFDSARKLISDTCNSFPVKDENKQNAELNGGGKSKKHVSFDDLKMEDYYSQLNFVSSVEEISVGDQVAFKVLELDERYNPSISKYKEGFVSGKSGMQITITYTKNNTIVRSGKYDLDDNEYSNGDELKLETVELNFSELLEPKFILQQHSFNNSPLVDETDESCLQRSVI